MTPACPLCRARDGSSHFHEPRREYFRCPSCDLVYLRPEQRPGPDVEAQRYALHVNDRDDPGYLQHLRQLADPLSAQLPAGARGLDFGSGPTPAMADILHARGFHVASYDPVFFPDRALLDRTYDFVTCSEVLEHVHDPAATFDALARLLRPAATLGVMTRFHDGVPFDTWWYRRDLTHVCFYSRATMEWVARVRGWTVEFPDANIAFFVTPPGHSPRLG